MSLCLWPPWSHILKHCMLEPEGTLYVSDVELTDIVDSYIELTNPVDSSIELTDPLVIESTEMRKEGSNPCLI